MEPIEVRIDKAINVSGLHRGEPKIYYAVTKVYSGVANTAMVQKKFWTLNEAQAYALEQWPNVPRIRGW